MFAKAGLTETIFDRNRPDLTGFASMRDHRVNVRITSCFCEFPVAMVTCSMGVLSIRGQSWCTTGCTLYFMDIRSAIPGAYLLSSRSNVHAYFKPAWVLSCSCKTHRTTNSPRRSSSACGQAAVVLPPRRRQRYATWNGNNDRNNTVAAWKKRCRCSLP